MKDADLKGSKRSLNLSALNFIVDPKSSFYLFLFTYA
jgi:hypothetical protein